MTPQPAHRRGSTWNLTANRPPAPAPTPTPTPGSGSDDPTSGPPHDAPGFALGEASAWQQLDVAPDECGRWRALGITPRTVRPWLHYGAGAAAAEPWIRRRIGAADSVRWILTIGDARAALVWIDSGTTLSEAVEILAGPDGNTPIVPTRP